MSKGTPSFGKKNKVLHTNCRRCGRHAYNMRKKFCAACGYGKTAKRRDYSWKNKKPTASRNRKD